MSQVPLKRTSVWIVFYVSVLGFGLGLSAQLLLLRNTGIVFSGNYLVVAILLLLVALVLYRGSKVKRFLDGKLPNLDPFYASSTYIWAKSSIIAGWFLTSLYGGVTLAVGLQENPNYLSIYLVVNLVAMASALLLGIVGIVVEGFCKAPPPPKAT